MEEDIAADNRLVAWWAQYQALLAKEEPDPSPKLSVVGTQEDQPEPEEELPLIVGWARREAAYSWGEQLLEALIAGGYEAEVRVHLEDRWYQPLPFLQKPHAVAMAVSWPNVAIATARESCYDYSDSKEANLGNAICERSGAVQ